MAPKTPFVSPSLFHSNVSFRHVLEGHDLTAPLTFDHIRRQGPSRYTDGGPSGVQWSNPYSFHDGVVDLDALTGSSTKAILHLKATKTISSRYI